MAMPYRYFTLPGHARERHACENTFAGSPLIPRHCGARLRPLEAGLALCGTPDEGDGVRKHCGKSAALTNGEAALRSLTAEGSGISRTLNRRGRYMKRVFLALALLVVAAVAMATAGG